MARETLTDQMDMFVEAYITSLNQTGAAREAGYANPNVQAARLMKHPLIRKEIERRLKRRKKAMSQHEVLERLAQQARGDIGDFLAIREQADPKDSTKTIRYAVVDLVQILESGYSHLIKSVTFTNNGPKIELYDAQAALLKLGEHYRLFGRGLSMTIDMSQFTDAELDRIAAGADPLTILGERNRGDGV